jgi:hypothetical protein
MLLFWVAQYKQFLFLQTELYSVKSIVFLYFFASPLRDLAISMSLISFMALDANLYEILSCFQFLGLLNFLFLRFSACVSTNISLNPLGSLFLIHLHIILTSAILSSSSSLRILYSFNFSLVC